MTGSSFETLQVPMASQIKGLAQLQQNAGTSRLIAAKAPGLSRMDIVLVKNYMSCYNTQYYTTIYNL